MPLTPLARRYDQFILDLDGCVWVGGVPTPGAVEALEALREAEKGIAFATNNAYESGEDLVAQLWKVGVRASLRDMVTVGGACNTCCRKPFGANGLVIGTLPCSPVRAAVSSLNATVRRPREVVGGRHHRLVYDDLRKAVQAVLRGATCGHSTRHDVPAPDGPWPGTGAVLRRGVRHRSARRVGGKPEAPALLNALTAGDGGRRGRRPSRLASSRFGDGIDAAYVLNGGANHRSAGFEPRRWRGQNVPHCCRALTRNSRPPRPPLDSTRPHADQREPAGSR